MVKRKLTKLVCVCMCVALAMGSLLGCSGTKAPERSANTINIRAYKGGYGSTYLSKLVEKFNEVYEDEGYKAVLLAPSTTMTGTVAQKEMASKNDWADIYYTSNIDLTMVVDNKDFGTLVNNIEDDVWQKPAIDFEGNEESVTIASKLSLDVDDDYSVIDGDHYGLFSNISVGGLLVNTEKLSRYGLDIPKTTNEMIECFDAIYQGNDLQKGSLVTNQYPITCLGGTNGYHSHFYNAWVAQYEGGDWWDAFWALEDMDGNPMIEDGYTLFESDGLREAMIELYRVYDAAYLAMGSLQNNLSTAHEKLMNPNYGAVFMADGDWAYNEIIVDNRDLIDNLMFINIPVISALGTKLFGEGTTYNFNADKCEEILSWVIDKTDEGKTSAEIVQLASTEKQWTLNETDVIEIMNARGIYNSRSQGAGAWWVCNKTEYPEICNLFLRMSASDDNAELMADEAHAFSAYSGDYSIMGDSSYWGGFADILGGSNAYGVWTMTTGIRKQVNPLAGVILPASGYIFHNEILIEGKSAYTLGTTNKGSEQVYATAADERLAKDIKLAKENWTKWMTDAGLLEN